MSLKDKEKAAVRTTGRTGLLADGIPKAKTEQQTKDIFKNRMKTIQSVSPM